MGQSSMTHTICRQAVCLMSLGVTAADEVEHYVNLLEADRLP